MRDVCSSGVYINCIPESGRKVYGVLHCCENYRIGYFIICINNSSTVFGRKAESFLKLCLPTACLLTADSNFFYLYHIFAKVQFWRFQKLFKNLELLCKTWGIRNGDGCGRSEVHAFWQCDCNHFAKESAGLRVFWFFFFWGLRLI